VNLSTIFNSDKFAVEPNEVVKLPLPMIDPMNVEMARHVVHFIVKAINQDDLNVSLKSEKEILELDDESLMKFVGDYHQAWADKVRFYFSSNYPRAVLPKDPVEFFELRMKYIREALRTGDIQIYDQEITLSDRLRIEEVRITVCGENEVLVIVRDISDRKLAEIALRESEERLKASESLLNSMFTRSPVGLAITDIDGKFVRTNPCYQAMVGYSESELESMRFTDITLAEDLEENLRMRNLILNGECDSYQIEKRFFQNWQRYVLMTQLISYMCLKPKLVFMF
jgi:PAS domain S-box-containing protein